VKTWSPLHPSPLSFLFGSCVMFLHPYYLPGALCSFLNPPPASPLSHCLLSIIWINAVLLVPSTKPASDKSYLLHLQPSTLSYGIIVKYIHSTTHHPSRTTFRCQPLTVVPLAPCFVLLSAVSRVCSVGQHTAVYSLSIDWFQ
jgi:hypothetical protein